MKTNWKNIKYLVKNYFFKNKKFKIDGQIFIFPISSIKDYLNGFKFYELSERKLIKKYVSIDDKILELGANVGVISCISNSLIKLKTNHVVVEPNPKLLKYLTNNKKINSSGYKIENKIISENSKVIDFYIEPENSHGSSIINREDRTTNKIQIECITLEALKKKYRINFNVLIMDIEGGEFNFIIENSLCEFKKLIIEFHPDILSKSQYNQCYKILSKNFALAERIETTEMWVNKY